MDKVLKFATIVCDFLKIELPTFEESHERFLTDTMIALLVSTERKIYLHPEPASVPDQFFAVAHELRHLWQLETNERFYMQDYKSADKLTDEQYNMQQAEIDANAFAKIAMANICGIAPQFNALPEVVKNAIEKRINEIVAE